MSRSTERLFVACQICGRAEAVIHRETDAGGHFRELEVCPRCVHATPRPAPRRRVITVQEE